MRLMSAALLILAAAPAVAAPVVIQPVAVTASSTFWTYDAQNLINGSGLSGGLHDGNYNNHWMTDTTGEPAWLVFDLGKVARLADIRIWNYNVDFGMGYSLVRGAKDFTVSLSTDGVTFAPVIAGTLAKGAGLPLPAQVHALSGDARYVRLDLVNNHGDQWQWTGLGEVRLGAVPEAATWAMMIMGFGLVGTAMRRRRAIAA